MQTKWWGWGKADVTYSLDQRPQFWPYLERQLGRAADRATPPVDRLAIALRPSRLKAEALEALRALVGPEGVTTDPYERLLHSYGKSYRDLVRLRRGEVPHPPDAVLYPADHDQVSALLQYAATQGIRVIPFGGGTSVVGGVEPTGERPLLTLDLARLDRVLAIDEVALTARIQAGTLGPDLERQLSERGFLLGHAPQSFEFSTLGGWLATRSAGQQSGRYGKIEDMVVSLKVSTPTGTLETPLVPAHAMGPDLKQLVVGSEGILGVITEATMRIHPVPAVRDYRGYLLKDFPTGLRAARELAQGGPVPATLRLSDPHETAALFKLREAPASRLAELLQKVGQWVVTQGGSRDVSGRCLLLVGYEGSAQEVAAAWDEARHRLGRYDPVALGGSIGRSWFRSRFDLPYLRDTLMDRGVMVDTLETAGEWSGLATLYERVDASLRQALAQEAGQGFVMCHVSHAYPDGASLYFTFAAHQVAGRELEQWSQAKKAATDCLAANGGAISHHHGIGRDHAPWLPAAVGPLGIAAVRAVKSAWDPAGVMNPTTLVPPEADPLPKGAT